MIKAIYKTKNLVWGLQLRGRARDHYDRELGSRQADAALRVLPSVHKQQAVRAKEKGLKPSDTPPPMKSHLLTLPKQFHQTVK